MTLKVNFTDNDVGDVKVFKDAEMDGREYICLNYEIIYLDNLKNNGDEKV